MIYLSLQCLHSIPVKICAFKKYTAIKIKLISFLFKCQAVKSHCTLPAQQQTADSVREQLVNIVGHLAAKETDISLRTWWRPKIELKEREYWTSPCSQSSSKKELQRNTLFQYDSLIATLVKPEVRLRLKSWFMKQPSGADEKWSRLFVLPEPLLSKWIWG